MSVWVTLRTFSEGSVRDPPSCATYIIAANKRGVKKAPQPRLGLFPCLPLPNIEGSIEDCFVNAIIGLASYVAVGGNPAPLALFRRTTSKEHVSLMKHIRSQLRDSEEGMGNLDPWEALGSGRSGRLLSDALHRAGATGPISSLHGSKGFATGIRVQDLASCAVMPLVSSRLAFPKTAADWDLAEFLHGEVKQAYLDPSVLRVQDEPRLPKGKVCGSKRESLRSSL